MRKKAKILLSVLFAVVLCICFCACGKGEQKNVTTSDTVLRETAASAEVTTPAGSMQTAGGADDDAQNEAAEEGRDSGLEQTTAPGYLAETTAPGYLAETTSGYLTETTSGYLAETTSGYLAETTSGYLAETTSGYLAETTSGYLAETTSGYLAETTSGYGTEQTTIGKTPEETTTVFGNGAPVEDVTEELQRDRELQLVLQLSDPVDYDNTKEALCLERLQSICTGENTMLYSPERPYYLEGQTIKNETDVIVTTPEESLNWLAENIYSIKSDVVKKFKKDCSTSTGMTISRDKGGGTITYKDDSYIGVRPASSKPVYYCSVVSAQKSKDTYKVRYMLAGYESSKKIYCTAIMKQNEVDGQNCWSILSVSRETEG